MTTNRSVYYTMSHNSAVFNHSCLKVPINPDNKLPAPNYEQKYLNQLKNESLRNFMSETEKMRTTKNLRTKYKAFIDFYDSIPDYSDVNHLSNKEFYKKLEGLKAKQKCYYDYLDTELNIENKSDDYKQKKSPKNLRDTPDSEFSSKDIIPPPSRRSVRIESPDISKMSPKSSSPRDKRNICSAGSKFSESSKILSIDSVDEDKDFCDDILKDNDDFKESGSRSLPSSPTKSKSGIVWNDCGITIPKPFKMTVRDEEDKIIEEILLRNQKKPRPDKSDLFRAHPVPIESKIPLFDKIMEEQEIRRQIIKHKSKEMLKSKMKPFSFTRREEEEQALTRRFSKSSPQLTYEEIPLKIKPFKAKPVPKNLFSNYIYAKMHEDEFYRALKRRIRAEELLKASSLPPSMAQRELTKAVKPICPRALREIEREIDNQILEQEKQELQQLKLSNRSPCGRDSQNSFITTSRPFKFHTEQRIKKRARSAKKCHRASEYEINNNKRAQSAMELQSVNRSNLAAVLRIQSASFSNNSSIPTTRKRMEREMEKKLEDNKWTEEARWREKVMRQKPVWQELNFTSEDDIAMRLQMRRDEEKLREQEHRHHMEVMLGRVQQIPTLFERQTQYSLDYQKERNKKRTDEESI